MEFEYFIIVSQWCYEYIFTYDGSFGGLLTLLGPAPHSIEPIKAIEIAASKNVEIKP